MSDKPLRLTLYSEFKDKVMLWRPTTMDSITDHPSRWLDCPAHPSDLLLYREIKPCPPVIEFICITCGSVRTWHGSRCD